MVTRSFGPNQTPDRNEPANVGNNPTTGTAPDRNPTAATNGASRQPIWPASRTRRQQFPLTAGLRNPSPSIPMTSRLGISPANRFLTGVRGRTPRLEDLNPTSTHTVLHPGFNFATGTFQQHPNPNQRNHPVSSTSNDRSVANSQPPPTGQAEEVEVVQLTLTLDNDGDIDDAIGSQVDEESTAGPEPEPQWIDIHINYQFHVVQAANNPPNNPRARKQKSASSSTQDDLPKTMKLEVKDNKIVVPWALNNLDLARFKRETIDAIRQNVNEWLACHAKDLEGRGAIEWQVAIKNGGAFAGAQNQVLLPSNDTFQRFLEAADRLPEGKMKTCTLVQEDPKVVAQNELAFKQLKAHHTPNDNPGEPSREPTAGASGSLALHDLMREIYAAHDPCERLSHLPEVPVCINPEDPTQYFPITCHKADAWAWAICANPEEVTALRPPRSFTYVTGPSGNSATPAQGPSNRRAPPAPNAPESVTKTGLPADSNGSPDIRDHLVAEYLHQQSRLAAPPPQLNPFASHLPQLRALFPPERWFPDQQSTQDELLQQIAPYPQAFLGQTFPGQPSVFPTTPSFPGQAWPGQAFPGQAFPGQPYAHAFPQQQQTNVAHGHQPNSVHQEQNQLNPAAPVRRS
ncbi:hypothetical protein PSTG_09327 [Puccinia striiformis f. sp. tritici PST-78]|uniref:Uncharacterized protein n=1 Tax=Puccinia striiformis f. sp. tritici PST-78 TaxID=1165861 RepID=A0A0L0VEC8_9BASI|nr:hypothetical protein PSTG_09327 [Puccinia striiformis f. sp. tritici PST-78]